jgi:Trk K+ transport system NAD-binding subunit
VDRPVILCGLGKVGWRVLEFLLDSGLPLVVVDRQADPADPRLRGVRLVRGDFQRPETLQDAGVADARGVLVLAGDDLANISAALLVRRLNPSVRVVVRLFNQGLIPRLGKAVPDVSALSVSALSAPLLAQAALTGEVLAAFDLSVDACATTGPGGKSAPDDPGRARQIALLTVDGDSPLIGRRLGGVAGLHRLLILAHRPEGGADRFLTEVDGEARLALGDRLAVCATPADLAPLLQPGAADEKARFAGRLRRSVRVAWRAFKAVDLPVRICTLVLVGVLAVSTAVYVHGMGRSAPDALYQTVSVIATGADMHGETYGPWQKVFVSALRICGAALTAAFTAIVTNYLLRARLEGVFEARRLPEGGHVVVCGLGNIGFRVVEELLRAGRQVVAVEADGAGRFVATCRRMGVPVLVGDATVQEVLRQAKAVTARAVVACSSAELTNLEIALVARDLRPDLRAVVRVTDPVFAETLRAAADIRLAVSVPSLAAPAFVAAFFGDTVRAVVRVGDRLLAVVELVVPAGDAGLEGQSVRALAVDYDLKPVALVPADPSCPLQPESHRLAAGDRLTVVTTTAGLERLYRREAPPADWSVEVTAYPMPAREGLALELRRLRSLTAEEADAEVGRLPFVLRSGLTRGQAEELIATLERERVTARLRQGEAVPA